ncbi:YhgE/Pip domain-containing protein [Pseudogracilibacillus auburnensis]|uniref:YhgE/Pip-like protein n=1 Tax=Pseudogracilibacillus auburnensis TaxID=1494959 RepID=A0A2V3VY57_9BACI|nr:ABC transporter permease [Pseudogracilibacillus auburnensis]MBO1004062.1 ABC transporter permease [Pseudogracilibacillus auburnensis]PXW85648.1 YhgE/Pip-like protein [Pseudogracilibacillus auburnensis]
MKVMKGFFKQKETLLGIAVAILFQLIFFIVWLTAYDGVFDRTDQLKIAVVNEDILYGKQIEKQLEDDSIVDVKLYTELKDAEKDLNQRKVNMIIHLPKGMTEQLQKGYETAIHYYINQSSPSLTKQMMEKVATEMNTEINGQVYTVIEQQMAKEIPKSIAAHADNKDMVQQVASQVVEVVQQHQLVNPIQKDIILTNEREGFAATMIPLLVVLASYIGAMLLSQHLQFAENNVRSQHHTFSLFFTRQFINLIVALTLSLFIIGLMSLFDIRIDRDFFVVWGFQATLLYSFLSLSQLFVMLFGNPGMIFNIALVATQLVSSGAIVPRELLSSFFQRIGDILPATYGVNGYFSLIYGGGNLRSDVQNLFIIIGITFIIAIGSVLIKGRLTKAK